MSSTPIQQIEKLNSINYESWKIQMKRILQLNDLWTYVNGTIEKTIQNQIAWTAKDEKALDLITVRSITEPITTSFV
ncbi:hypothetical protein ANTQUA_LOCUS10468 [Anthophora quadrimaculata]